MLNVNPLYSGLFMPKGSQSMRLMIDKHFKNIQFSHDEKCDIACAAIISAKKVKNILKDCNMIAHQIEIIEYNKIIEWCKTFGLSSFKPHVEGTSDGWPHCLDDVLRS